MKPMKYQLRDNNLLLNQQQWWQPATMVAHMIHTYEHIDKEDTTCSPLFRLDRIVGAGINILTTHMIEYVMVTDMMIMWKLTINHQARLEGPKYLRNVGIV
uniref:Uncharacterized protein n=1 Tax=Salix viminalis TaxID=40686 RepID=A0A6N2LWJ8_SALVM